MITTTSNLRNYISVSAHFQFAEFEPYIIKAQRTFMHRFVGKLYDKIDTITVAEDKKDILSQAKSLVDCAVANFGYYLFTPYASLSLDASGMYNHESENRTKISVWQMNDIRRDLLRAGHEAMDELLEILEKNKDVFQEWHSGYSTIYNELLVNSTTVFQKNFNISNSRQTFLSLQPAIRLVEEKILKTTFCKEILSHLKSNDLKETEVELKELLQQAVVFATVSKVCSEGIFELTATGIKMKFDALDYEKIVPIDKLNELRKTSENFNNDSNQILQRAVNLIKENSEVFNQCNNNPLIEKQTNGYKPIITKSILGL